MSQRHVPNTVVFKQLASLHKLEELAIKFEQAQISRKPQQVGGQTGTSLHKLKTCDDLRSRLIKQECYMSFSDCHRDSNYWATEIQNEEKTIS